MEDPGKTRRLRRVGLNGTRAYLILFLTSVLLQISRQSARRSERRRPLRRARRLALAWLRCVILGIAPSFRWPGQRQQGRRRLLRHNVQTRCAERCGRDDELCFLPRRRAISCAFVRERMEVWETGGEHRPTDRLPSASGDLGLRRGEVSYDFCYQRYKTAYRSSAVRWR